MKRQGQPQWTRCAHGTIAVTNNTGTAVVNVGSYTSGGKGLLTMQHQTTAGDTSLLNYPVLMADSFLVTSNSTFTFTAGDTDHVARPHSDDR